MARDYARLVLVTTDFKPRVGGVAEYLHGLWHHVACSRPVTVMTTVPGGSARWSHEYRLLCLPRPPGRRLGERRGDPVAVVRKLHTAVYFMRLERFARRTITTMRESVGANAQAFVGIWDTESHFWCKQLQRARLPYSLGRWQR